MGDGLTGVTQMPSAASVAASFDTSLAYQYGQVVGSEERAKGAMVDLGPTVNIDRDPRWGREFEAYTEDPYLNSALAVADVDGVQSTGEMAQIKHYAVYNQETNRNAPADNAIVSTRAEQEIYLPAFYAGTTQAHAASVMCSYSYINGQAACQNQYLLQTTLDQNWGYPGFVTSDYGATHSTVQSADAGNDQEMPSAQFYGPALQSAVQDGQVSIATLNGMVSRILTEMFKFNEFNNPPTGSTSATVTTAAHQAVSTSVAEAGTVLLKNSGGTLPLAAKGAGTVAVIGPAASAAPTDTRRRQRPRDLDLQRHPAAGHPGRGRDRHHGELRAGPAHRHVPVADPDRQPDPGLRGDRLRRELHRHADRPGDRHLRAGVPEPWLVQRDQPVPGRQGDPLQPGHPAGLHLLGQRRPDGRPDLHAVAFWQRPVGRR